MTVINIIHTNIFNLHLKIKLQKKVKITKKIKITKKKINIKKN